MIKHPNVKPDPITGKNLRTIAMCLMRLKQRVLETNSVI